MAQFQHSFPELQDSAMNLSLNNGFPTINGVPFASLRLHQLRNLARAWRIPIDRDAPKQDILPALMAAARQGTFKNPPSLPYYAHMAMRTGDEHGPINHPHFEYPDGMPAPKPIADDALPSDLKRDKTQDPFHKMYVQWTYDDLKTEVKKLDPTINLYGISRAAAGRFLYERGVTPEHKPLKAEHFPEEVHADN